ALEKVASYIVSSSSIDIAGIGGSAITAEYLKKELTRLKLRANAYTDNYTIANDMPSMDKNTLLICISCSGASEEILELARQAKASGTTLVAMTSTDNTILEKIADVTVQVQSQVSFYDDGSYLARIGQFTTILTLSILIARKLAQQNSDLKNNFYNYTNYKNINSKENS
ncbi:MAG: SIS domain-containing protein, partial [Sphaerochaetaceae bacterium]|nr:SIS domain-containing protein [Sphaerochaetaceae bacterium]